MFRFLSLLTFLFVFAGVVGGAHYYLWTRWVRDPHVPTPWSQLATAVIVLAGVCMVAAPILYRVVEGGWTQPFIVSAYLWFGLAFYAVLLLVAADFLSWVSSAVQRFGDGPIVPERRLAMIRAFSASAAFGSALLTSLAARGASAVPGVKRVSVHLDKLPTPLKGLRIVQLSDIHVGPTIGREFLEGVVDKVNALEPDVVVITGDLVDGSVRELGDSVAPLKDLRARHGVFFSTGNHEYYSGVTPWMKFLPSLNVRVLRNERVLLEHEGARCYLAGVDDHTAGGFGVGHGPDYEQALAGIDPNETVILLAHQPKQIEAATRVGVDLVLSGHTHGGQLWPFGALVRLAQPYVSGLHQHDERAQIYVSRGTGYWGPPMRLGAPAEITELILD
ncbi:MAG: metallophosphoesterase [Myxococcota bacterium]